MGHPYIEVGNVGKREIDHALPQAKVGLLLISPHFLDSDFIMNHEVPPLEEASENGLMHKFCGPISSSLAVPTCLDKYQWARPPKEPLDLLPEPEQHAAIVRISKTLVEIFPKKANVSRFIPGQIDVISPYQPIAVTPSPVPLRMFSQPVHLNQEKTDPLGMLYGVPSQRPHSGTARGA
ncbi:MAG: hypothetical protein NPIRA06_15300 [Nitrospirales bacterium]|nr:MAG: hypothetical protein NPIRA06_15300 [Nitrospirales bacterium]